MAKPPGMSEFEFHSQEIDASAEEARGANPRAVRWMIGLAIVVLVALVIAMAAGHVPTN